MFGTFMRDTRGNVAMVFGLFIMVFFVVAGGAVDFLRRGAATTAVQESLDAAVLAAVRATNLSDDDRRTLGEQMFAANMAASNFNVSAVPNIEFNGGSVTASIDFEMPTVILNVAGMTSLRISGQSEAVGGSLGSAELVMVLDYSSSMDNKYEEMRDAAIEFIDIITNDGAEADISFGLVPFAAEIYTTLDGAYVLDGVAGVPWTNCTRDRRYSHNINDETPIAGDDDSKWGRTDGNDVIDADEYQDCDEYVDNELEIQPLSNDHSATTAKLLAMTPHAGTNITVGVEFAAHVLSPNPPWIQGAAYGGDTGKYLIILSDGRHNRDGFGPGSSNNADQARQNMATLCTMLKAKGVLVATIAYDLDDDDGKAELEQCASASQYYLEGDEDNIQEQFEVLANLLLADEIHLTR